jgi:hypothetical protein
MASHPTRWYSSKLKKLLTTTRQELDNSADIAMGYSLDSQEI